MNLILINKINEQEKWINGMSKKVALWFPREDFLILTKSTHDKICSNLCIVNA